MVRKLPFSPKFTFKFYLCILFFCFNLFEIKAQCAGNDNNLSVCDITNVNNQSIDLNLLLGAYTAGGSWSDDDGSGGLNLITGILNAQKIFKSGIYHYTYKVENVAGCVDNDAVITITIGGYSGVPGPNNSICSSDQSYSLFQVFQGIPVLAPQSGGTWTDLDNSGGLNAASGVLNAKIPIPYNNYSYKYTIPAIGNCIEVSSQISVSIYRSPEPGTPINLKLCSNELSSYTNLDLFTQLNGEDAGGVWTESGTSEITDPTDSTIDIQNIFNTKGPGYYRFTYTVSPPKDDRVCTNQSSTVFISIGEQLDFTGAELVISPDAICENLMPTTTYTGILRQGIKPIANGNYRIDYSIVGVGSFSTIQNFSNGVLFFPIPSSSFSLVKDYKIRITNITLTSSPVFCSSIMGTIEDVLQITPSPKINDANLIINPVCQGSDGLVNFSGTSNLSDGDYDIIYNLSGSNALNGIPATMNVIGGLSTFTIPSAYIPKTGTTTITITKITNNTTGCSNPSALKTDFIVNPSLDLNNLVIAVDNVCQNQPAIVKINGLGVLTAIDVTYNLSGVNNVGSKIVSLTATSGQGTFSIPAIDIPNKGLTTLYVTNITNSTTGCTFNTNNKQGNFNIISLPNVPVAADEQTFCSAENATIANLSPQGVQYQWFDSAISTIPLANTALLLTGDYYVKEKNQTTGCESGLKKVHITINDSPQIDSARLSIGTTCQSYTVTVLLGGTSNLTNGLYSVRYNLSGDNIATAIDTDLNVNNGIGIFTIPANIAPKAGSTTVSITNIKNVTTGCSNLVNLSAIFKTNPYPDISNMIVTIKEVCQGQSVTVELSGLDSLTKININFKLVQANILAEKTISLDIVAGITTFEIPATDVPNAGVTTFNITNITNTVNGCPIFINQKTDFTVNAPPDVSTLAVVIPDGCPNQPLNVAVSGLGNLNEILLSYSFSGANTIVTQIIPLVVVNGATIFSIPGEALTTAGTNTLMITNLTNKLTGCSTAINSLSQDFKILTIPNNPIANNQGFCKEDSATVANLIPNGSQYKWYDSLNSTTPLLASTPLVSANYYLKEANPTTGCESNATTIIVSINNVPTPTLNQDGQNFCGADKPTIQNLSNNTNHTGNLTWYNSATNGTAITNSEILIEGNTYYGIDYNTITQCSSEALAVTVTLNVCNVTPDGLMIPDAFSPNGDGVNDTFKIIDIEYLFPNFTLEIYNRYGNIMFKGNVNKPDWDGKNSNSSFINGDSATGVYFYIINYNKDNFSPRQGQLYLNR